MTPHTADINRVLLYLSKLGCMVARRDVGLFYDLRGNPRHIGHEGEADIQGRTACGRAIAVEVKRGRDRLKPKQEAWRAAWVAGNGLYALVRVDENGEWMGQLRALVESVRGAQPDQPSNRKIRPTKPPPIDE